MRGLNLWIIFKIFVLLFVVYTLFLVPPAAVFKYGVFPLFSKGVFSFFLGLVFSIADFWLLLFSAIILPGMIWRALKFRYSGIHTLDLSDKDVRNWLFSLVIYLPAAVILDFFHLYPLKSLHIRLFGGEIGKNVVIGGLVLDPSLLEVDDNTVIGGFSTIVGHAVERGKIYFEKVRIGKSCGIGIRATVLPGAHLEDGSMLGAQSLLLKRTEIPTNETYGGVPARCLKSK